MLNACKTKFQIKKVAQIQLREYSSSNTVHSRQDKSRIKLNDTSHYTQKRNSFWYKLMKDHENIKSTRPFNISVLSNTNRNNHYAFINDYTTMSFIVIIVHTNTFSSNWYKLYKLSSSCSFCRTRLIFLSS